jgi:hypothetical protein
VIPPSLTAGSPVAGGAFSARPPAVGTADAQPTDMNTKTKTGLNVKLALKAAGFTYNHNRVLTAAK